MNSSNSLSETAGFSNIWSEFRSRVGYYFCFSKAVFFASGFLFSDKLIDYLILRLSTAYFIDPSKVIIVEKDFMNAAIFTMILQAASALLELAVLKFMSKSLLSCLLVIIVSTLCYCFGLKLLLHVLKQLYLSGTESDAKLAFAYDITGILLLALAHAGVQPVIGEFIVEQFKKCEPDPANLIEDRVIARKNVWCRIVWTFSAVAALVTYRLVERKLLLVVPLCATASSSLILCSTLLFYRSGELPAIGSLFTGIPRNLKAFQVEIKRLIRKQDRDSGTSPEQGETAHGGELKIYIRKMGCMWSTFVLFGMFLSGGKIFFPLQGGRMMIHRKYLPSLVIIQSVSCKMISLCSELFVKWLPKSKQGKAKLMRMWLGMMLSVPCFIVAWRAEGIRVRKPHDIIYVDSSEMSIFWLVPQFCFLGFMEGLAQDGLDDYMVDLFPETRKHHLSAINNFVIGLGNFGNPLILYGRSKIYGVDDHYLEEYFKILIIIASVNLCCTSLIFQYIKECTADSDVNTRRPSDDSKQSKCLPEILAAFVD